MKEKKEKVTLLQALKAQMRGMKLLGSVCPKFFPVNTCYSLVSALLPYVTVFCSAQVLSELAGQRRPHPLWLWAGITVAALGIFALLKAYLEEHSEALFDDMFGRKEMLYTQKAFTMDYAALDRQENRDLRSQIAQNENWSGWGLMRTPEVHRDVLESIIGILSGIVLTVSLFTRPVPLSAGGLMVLNSPLFLLLLIAALVGVSLLAGYFRSRVMACWSQNAEMATYGNRLFSYFGFMGLKKGRCCDIRMYDQQRLVQHYWNEDFSFGSKGAMGKLAMGRMGLYAGISQAITALLTGLTYLFVCTKAWAGAFDVGSVTQYVGAVTALAVNIYNISSRLGLMRTNAVYLQQSFEYLDIPNDMYQGSLTTEKRTDRQYQVEFRNVSFRYPGSETWALKNVNFTFRVGQRLAIVGENGSGKTTFIKLLCRLYDPQEGQILLNGIDIRKYDYGDYMNIFSVVFQDFQLLSQSLGSNVAGCCDYNRDRVTGALLDAGFGERLQSLPQGLDTQLYREFGEEGVEVSGGEGQKIAIARALYKDAPFIILDEPTAALDPIAEAEIYEKFDAIARDRTAIYISHRLSSCKFCDEIAVFDGGRVIQQGSHESLLSDEKGKYHALWQAQAQYYQEK